MSACVARGIAVAAPAALFAAFVLAHAAASAEPSFPTAGDLTDLSLETLLAVEVKTVQSASKYAQKTTHAPSSVSVLTADDFRRFGWNTLGDALRSVRGFHVSDNRNYQFLGARGFSRPGDYNSRVLVLIDGHRTNDAIYGQGATDSTFPLDVDLIDRIEIVRGPGSSLYGSGAFFAVINVIPKSGAQLAGGEVAARVARYGTTQGRASAGQRFDSGLELTGSFSALHSQGNRGLQVPELAGDPASNLGYLGAADAEVSRSALLGFKYRDVKVTYVDGYRDKHYGTGLYGTVFADPVNLSRDVHRSLDAQYEHDLGEGARVFARGFYHDYRYRSPMHFVTDPTTNYREGANSKWWGTEMRYLSRSTRRHRYTAGVEFIDYFENRQFSANENPPQAFLDVNRPFTTAALFGQDEITLSDRWTFTAGLRFDRLGQGHRATSPRLAAVYAPDELTAVKLLYGTAFRAPLTYETDYVVPGFNKGNAGLRPERIQTLELAAERVFSGSLRGSASVYQYRVKDLISQITDTDGLIVFRNLDRVRTRGVEVELEGHWGGFNARGSVALQRAEDGATGQRLSNAPMRLAKLNVWMPLLNERTTLAIEVQQTAQRYGDSQTGVRPLVGGHRVANLTLTTVPGAGKVTLAAGVLNLFDRRYGDPTSSDDNPALLAVPQNGRAWWAKVTVRF